MTPEEIKQVLKALKLAKWHLDYNQFCKLLGLDPKYSEKYFIALREGVDNLGKLDDTNLVKVIKWGENYG